MAERLRKPLINIAGGLALLGLTTGACESPTSLTGLSVAALSSPSPERSATPSPRPTVTPSATATEKILPVITAGPVIRRGTPEIVSIVNIPATLTERSVRAATATSLPTPLLRIPRNDRP